MENYNRNKNIGYKFTLENFENNVLKSKLSANYIEYDTVNNNWKARDYFIRKYQEKNDEIIKGLIIDTVINLSPSDLAKNRSLVETMGMKKLNQYIKQEEIKGTAQIVYHKIEKHKRIANPFSTIILTVIAVAIGSKKIRGGAGIQLSLGLLMSFAYILFMQISTTFATNSNLLPIIAVWIPNLIFTVIAFVLVRFSMR